MKTEIEWFKLGDKLPEESGFYLTARVSDSGNISIFDMHYSKKNKSFNSFDDLEPIAEIVPDCWAEMPKLPKVADSFFKMKKLIDKYGKNAKISDLEMTKSEIVKALENDLPEKFKNHYGEDFCEKFGYILYIGDGWICEYTGMYECKYIPLSETYRLNDDITAIVKKLALIYLVKILDVEKTSKDTFRKSFLELIDDLNKIDELTSIIDVTEFCEKFIKNLKGEML